MNHVHFETEKKMGDSNMSLIWWMEWKSTLFDSNEHEVAGIFTEKPDRSLHFWGRKKSQYNFIFSVIIVYN